MSKGHRVSVHHATDAPTTVARIVSMFPPEEQEIARLRLSEALAAVVSQRLLPRADGKGRCAALEILIATATVRDMIKDQNRTHELHDYMKESREQYGMQTFDQHLMELVAAGTVKYETALTSASNPADFELRTFVNGTVVQETTADDLLFGVAYQLADLCRVITLEPGDVLLTGTPRNSRPMEVGDVVEVEISGLGRLTNTVEAWDVDLSGPGDQLEVSPNTLHVALAIPEDEAERLAAEGRTA